MPDFRGFHGPNTQYLDPFGRFPGKNPVRQDISDKNLFSLILQKARLFKPKSIEWMVYNYADDPNQPLWLGVQKDIISAVHQAFPGVSKVLRLDHHHYVDPNPVIGLAKAPLMARDFAPIINELTQVIQDSGGQPPIWLRFANEPNHPNEGFNQDADYFNEWFKTIVWQFWNVYPIPDKYDGSPHGMFYPGLVPNLGDLDWYQKPSTQDMLLNWANGLEFHIYWETSHADDPDWGKRYELLWNQAIAPVNPNLPVIIGEWGNSSPPDSEVPSTDLAAYMNNVKLPEYEQWLTALASQSVIPNILGSHCFIIDGTWDWRKYFLTLDACRAIGKMTLN